MLETAINHSAEAFGLQKKVLKTRCVNADVVASVCVVFVGFVRIVFVNIWWWV